MDSSIIVALIGGVVTIGNVVFTTIAGSRREKRTKHEIAEMQASERGTHLKNGVCCLLRAELIRSHEKYMDKSYCPVYARDALTRAYSAYHELGGNGTITALYNQCMTLPTEQSDENENS